MVKGENVMSYKASIAFRSAPLAGEFGAAFAARVFPAEVLAAMPKFVKGPKAGKLKGAIEWIKVERGGWVRSGPEGEGHVERRVGQVIAHRLVVLPWGAAEPEIWAEAGEAWRFGPGQWAAGAAKPASPLEEEYRVYAAEQRACGYEVESFAEWSGAVSPRAAAEARLAMAEEWE
jgi:hypothetical protein